MTKQSKSLTDEIYDEFHRLLKNSNEFDDDILEKLNVLIKKGDMRKSQQVVTILKESTKVEK